MLLLWGSPGQPFVDSGIRRRSSFLYRRPLHPCQDAPSLYNGRTTCAITGDLPMPPFSIPPQAHALQPAAWKTSLAPARLAPLAHAFLRPGFRIPHALALPRVHPADARKPCCAFKPCAFHFPRLVKRPSWPFSRLAVAGLEPDVGMPRPSPALSIHPADAHHRTTSPMPRAYSVARLVNRALQPTDGLPAAQLEPGLVHP